MTDTEILLNGHASPEERLEALKRLDLTREEGSGEWVNNHIHTTYSFSPYTPAAAVYYAHRAGLSTAGIMDHDSVGGIHEFLKAGEIAHMPVTVGFECRTSVSGTPMEGRRLNNPDQVSVAYVTLHGIPHQSLPLCEKFLAPLREKRNERNIKMCEKINSLCTDIGVSLDFYKDVVPLSSFNEGGSVTERHVLFALAVKLSEGRSREESVNALKKLCTFSEKNEKRLLSADDSTVLYDMLGVLKSSLVKKIYVDAEDELMHITDFVRLAKKTGGICAYAYLGDVGESPTGDKAAQQFEDSYLEELFMCLRDWGINAVTYMPSRNTKEQLSRVISLCDRYGFFQISGEDINSPGQSFVCNAMQDYPHLYEATYALIGHERAATECLSHGMFSDETVKKMPDLSDRIKYYAEIGRK